MSRQFCALIPILLGLPAFLVGSQPSIGLPAITPGIIAGGLTTTVRVSASLYDPNGTLLPTSVNVLQVDQTGAALAILGTLNDSGTAPDDVANDGIFSGNVTVFGFSGTPVRIRVSAAFRGSLLRTLSSIATLDIVPPGLPTDIAPSNLSTPVLDPASGDQFVCDQVIVFFKTGTNITTIQHSVSNIGGSIIGVLSYPGRNAWQVRVPCTTATGILSAVAALESDPNTDGAAPNTISTTQAVVNDPLYPNQWGPSKIQADLAWMAAPIGMGAPIANPHPKMIGIVDTGIWYAHEDLHGKVLLGYNWVDGNTVPLDDNDHGTHVAGIASAFSNDNVGIAGVMSAEWLLAEKVCNLWGNCASTDVARGIKDAVDRGAQIINLSLASSDRNEDIAAAIDYANQGGRIVVAAAGNNDCGAKSYPAAFGDGETFSHLFGLVVHVYNAHVLAVGATDQNDARSIWSPGQAQCVSESGSNFGPWVVVYAPGTSILSTVRSNGYQYFDGTSMAAPHVSGAVAYVWSLSPSLSADQVRNVITSTADDTGATDPAGYRIHRLNVFKALKSALGPNLPTPWILQNVVFKDGGTASGFFAYAAATGQVTSWNLSVAGGMVSVFPAFTYTPSSSVFFRIFDGVSTVFDFAGPLNPLIQPNPFGNRSLRFVFSQPLTNTGGVIPLAIGNVWLGECYNCSPFRTITSGSVSGQ
jgi:thermitase